MIIFLVTKEAVSNAKFRAFETALFLFNYRGSERKRKKPQNEAKKSTTKRGSVKSLFLRLYSVAKNWFKMRSVGTNLCQFFLF